MFSGADRRTRFVVATPLRAVEKNTETINSSTTTIAPNLLGLRQNVVSLTRVTQANVNVQPDSADTAAARFVQPYSSR